jgi:hypothetical protein
VQAGGVLHLGELPGPHGRGAEAADLAGLDHVVQGLHGLLDRGGGVEAVDLVQVHVVGAEPAQGIIQLLEDRAAGQARPARSVVHLEEHLGRQDDVLAPGVGRMARPVISSEVP